MEKTSSNRQISQETNTLPRKRGKQPGSRMTHRPLRDTDTILRSWHATEATGLSLSTIMRMEKNGQFPQRRKLTSNGAKNAIGWIRSEVETWVKEREVVNSA